MQYSTGDTVVHPRHGLATVLGTTTGGGSDYVELFIEAKSLTIKVPVAALDDVGIRRPSTKDEATAILAILDEPSDVPTDWPARNAATLSRMGSADLAQATMVIRDLSRHASRIERPLSAAENTALNTCLDTVSRELSIALDLSPSETRELILQRLSVEADSVV